MASQSVSHLSLVNKSLSQSSRSAPSNPDRQQQPAGDASAGNDSDGEFDPSADMLVNDFDDEHTLEEEEEIGDNDNDEEIDDLQREGEMPLEQLLAMYGYQAPSAGKGREKPSSSSEAEVTSSSQPSSSCQPSQSDSQRLERDSEVSAGSSRDFWRPLPTSSGRLLYPDSDEDDDDDEEEDDDDAYDESEAVPEAVWKRQIQVGPDHQALVPDGVSEVIDPETAPYAEADVVLWDPSRLSEQEVESYLTQVRQTWDNENGPADVSTAELAQREFDALSLLHQCGYKTEDAIQRIQSQAVGNGVPSVVLNPADVESFENGLKVHGKDFHAIHKDQVPSRSVRELVQYYYTWKMSDRFKVFLLQLDFFTTKFRTDKRKFRSSRMNDESRSDDAADTSGSTSKTASSCPSHSLIPQHYGQAGGRVSADAGDCGHPYVSNGVLKASDGPEAGSSVSPDSGEEAQLRDDELTSSSSSTVATHVSAPVPSNLEVSSAGDSIDCT